MLPPSRSGAITLRRAREPKKQGHVKFAAERVAKTAHCLKLTAPR